MIMNWKAWRKELQDIHDAQNALIVELDNETISDEEYQVKFEELEEKGREWHRKDIELGQQKGIIWT